MGWDSWLSDKGVIEWVSIQILCVKGFGFVGVWIRMLGFGLISGCTIRGLRFRSCFVFCYRLSEAVLKQGAHKGNRLRFSPLKHRPQWNSGEKRGRATQLQQPQQQHWLAKV